MALIKCAECGKDISDKAAVCVHCGCPIAVSAQPNDPTKPAEVSADHSPRKLSMNFHAVLRGAANEKSAQTVYVEELGRNVEFLINNNTRAGEIIKITLQENSKYDYILFRAISVTRPRNADSASANTQPGGKTAKAGADFFNQFFGAGDQNIPTISIAAKLVGPRTASTTESVYVPEFNRTVQVNIPNSITEGQSFVISEGVNSALNGINRSMRVHIAKVTYMDTQKPAAGQAASKTAPASSSSDMGQKIKALKRRIYIKPVISLVFSVFFILSLAGTFVMMYLFPDGGTPEMLMNISGFGLFAGFLSVFYFKFFPYIVGRYPDPGFIKTNKIMKHLKKRDLLEKAVTEMENCELVPFGDKMCLSDSFLFPKKKNGVIIPCDELLWVYDSYSGRRGCGYLMLGTEKWGIECFSRIQGRKQYAQNAAAAIQALQKRNPSILVGETRENKKKYFQFIRK